MYHIPYLTRNTVISSTSPHSRLCCNAATKVPWAPRSTGMPQIAQPSNSFPVVGGMRWARTTEAGWRGCFGMLCCTNSIAQYCTCLHHEMLWHVVAYHGSFQYVAGYHNVFGEKCHQQGQDSARNCKTPWNRGAGTRFFPTSKKFFEFWRSAKTVERLAWWMVQIWIRIHHTARAGAKVQIPTDCKDINTDPFSFTFKLWTWESSNFNQFFSNEFGYWSCAAEFTTSLAPMTSTTSKFSMSGFTCWTNNAVQQSSTGARKHMKTWGSSGSFRMPNAMDFGINPTTWLLGLKLNGS